MNSIHLNDLDDFALGDLTALLNSARDIIANERKYLNSCNGKILATLFYEPSTRTVLSFQSAMYRLGGQVIGFDSPITSSVAKGENLKDTIKMINSYADIIVMRHYCEGAALAASLYSDKPVINAGDGGHLHPTQTLTDLLTLREEIGALNGLTVGLCGDLKHGRTVHSLVKAMCRYKDNKFVLISTKELSLPDYIMRLIEKSGCSYTVSDNLEACIPDLDVLYMTRIQKERFDSEEMYLAQNNRFMLTTDKLSSTKETLKILHPLPRNDEIATDVDNDYRATYFIQARYGVYARMALILHMLYSLPTKKYIPSATGNAACKNSKCVTQAEIYVPRLLKTTDERTVCEYCDNSV
jgi:aspartate carbamoyltransferase catalytic subunit